MTSQVVETFGFHRSLNSGLDISFLLSTWRAILNNLFNLRFTHGEHIFPHRTVSDKIQLILELLYLVQSRLIGNSIDVGLV